MIEKLTLKREHPPEWLLGSVPVINPNIVTLHGEAGQGVAVPLALLVADSQMAQSMLHTCEGPQKHVTITTEVEIIKLYVKLLSAGEMRINNNKRDDVRKPQELLGMLRSRIVLDIRDVQTPVRQHEVNNDIGQNDSQIRPEPGRDSSHSEVCDGTRRCDLNSNSDSNNNQDELDISQAEQERGADNFRMLSIIQREKSSSRVLSSKTGAKLRDKGSLMPQGQESADSSTSSIVGEREENAVKRRHPQVELSGSRPAESRVIDIVELDEDMDKVRDKMSAKEDDDDKDDDVEILDNIQQTSSSQSKMTTNNKQVFPCRKFSRVFASKRPCHKCYCGESFDTKLCLMSHIRQVHRDSDYETVQKKKAVDVQCPDCKVILRRSSLNRHQKESCKGIILN